ncbi:hypothetical protein, partial [Thermoflexus sp.]|uniref:hypothetical protein n=1 Tax=Thermoflexus sp. TaxID=1969742 RepID=UPI0035E45BC0
SGLVWKSLEARWSPPGDGVGLKGKKKNRDSAGRSHLATVLPIFEQSLAAGYPDERGRAWQRINAFIASFRRLTPA